MSLTMSRNEERANEEWVLEIAAHLTSIRLACAVIEASVRHSRDNAAAIVGAVARMDDATEALFKIRHGPERPE